MKQNGAAGTSDAGTYKSGLRRRDQPRKRKEQHSENHQNSIRMAAQIDARSLTNQGCVADTFWERFRRARGRRKKQHKFNVSFFGNPFGDHCGSRYDRNCLSSPPRLVHTFLLVCIGCIGTSPCTSGGLSQKRIFWSGCSLKNALRWKPVFPPRWRPRLRILEDKR